MISTSITVWCFSFVCLRNGVSSMKENNLSIEVYGKTRCYSTCCIDKDLL